MTGFAESVALLIDNGEPWFQTAIGTGLIIVLYLINIAGVKWVVRLQFVILAILIMAALDLAFGLFISHDPSELLCLIFTKVKVHHDNNN